ncbi:glycosyltransferase [Methanosarcina sp.]|uniref:glycosyltransferase n=1 Tax=Methanosarcina sp. TaxID=2213 RepID=UPI003BB811BB
MVKIMISIVCVYNNKKIFSDFLLKSLSNQTAKFELIGIDNTSSEFKSAAAALNYGGKRARNKYIMFVHQDVSFLPGSWLEDTERFLDSVSNLGIAGVAGMSESGSSNPERGRNIITHGNPSEFWPWGNRIQKPEPVQTLDECLVIIPKSTFDALEFDEKTCDGWHLYAVDYCLSANEMGFGVYVLPMEVYHLSSAVSKKKFQSLTGPLPDDYYETLDKLIKKHRSTFKRIYTTCGDWSALFPAVFQRSYYMQRLIVYLEKLRH